jgi:hypothetical protein
MIPWLIPTLSFLFLLFFALLILSSRDRLPMLENLALRGMLVLSIAAATFALVRLLVGTAMPPRPGIFLLVQEDLLGADRPQVQTRLRRALALGEVRVATFTDRSWTSTSGKGKPPPPLPAAQSHFPSLDTALAWVSLERSPGTETMALVLSRRRHTGLFLDGVITRESVIPEELPIRFLAGFPVPSRIPVGREVTLRPSFLLPDGADYTVRLSGTDGPPVEAGITGDGSSLQSVPLRFKPPGEGPRRLLLELLAPDGSLVERGFGRITVRLLPEIAWVTSSAFTTGRLPDLLRRGGYKVGIAAPRELPALLPSRPGRVLVLDDLPSGLLPWTTVTSLFRSISETGGGVLAVGGNRSFGPGGYAGTPAERLLPVWMGIRNKGNEKHSTALIVVMDTSGSMRCPPEGCPGDAERMFGPQRAQRGPRIQKIELAKQALLNLVPSMRAVDTFGVLGVKNAPYWEIKPEPLTDRRLVQERIRGIVAEGDGIYLYSGILEAYRGIEKTDAEMKHLVVLVDTDDIDETKVEEMGTIDGLLHEVRARGISVSFIAFGFSNDRFVPLLNRLAVAGGGYLYLTSDMEEIPGFLTQDREQLAKRQVIRRELTTRFTPEELPGVDETPKLAGQFITEPKPDARVPVWSEIGYPVAAYRLAGKGAIGAFAADSGGDLAPAWATEAALPAWDALLTALDREPPGETRLFLSEDADGTTALFVAGDTPLEGWTALLSGPDGPPRVVSLAREFPGLLSSPLRGLPPGAYDLSIRPSAGGKEVAGGTFRIQPQESPEVVSRDPFAGFPAKKEKKTPPPGPEELRFLMLLAAGLLAFHELYRRH